MSAMKLASSSWGEIEFGCKAGCAPLWESPGRSWNRLGLVNMHETTVAYSLWHLTLDLRLSRKVTTLLSQLILGTRRLRAPWLSENWLYRPLILAHLVVYPRKPCTEGGRVPALRCRSSWHMIDSSLGEQLPFPLDSGPGRVQRRVVRKYLWSLYLFQDFPKTIQPIFKKENNCNKNIPWFKVFLREEPEFRWPDPILCENRSFVSLCAISGARRQ